GGVVPPEAAIRKARRRRADGLADGEVDVVTRERDLARGHPYLGEGGVGVDQRGATEAVHHRRRLGVPEVQEQVGARGSVVQTEETGGQIAGERLPAHGEKGQRV